MDTPDIASIVSMIMSNPSLVEQISGMMRSDGKGSDSTDSPDTDVTEEVIAPAEVREIPNERRIHRVKLANAMKPYLSEGRRRAIDAMMSIADILDITREKK